MQYYLVIDLQRYLNNFACFFRYTPIYYFEVYKRKPINSFGSALQKPPNKPDVL